MRNLQRNNIMGEGSVYGGSQVSGSEFMGDKESMMSGSVAKSKIFGFNRELYKPSQ